MHFPLSRLDPTLLPARPSVRARAHVRSHACLDLPCAIDPSLRRPFLTGDHRNRKRTTEFDTIRGTEITGIVVADPQQRHRQQLDEEEVPAEEKVKVKVKEGGINRAVVPGCRRSPPRTPCTGRRRKWEGSSRQDRTGEAQQQHCCRHIIGSPAIRYASELVCL